MKKKEKRDHFTVKFLQDNETERAAYNPIQVEKKYEIERNQTS